MLTVVTGASGHVGANLVRALLAKGRKVRAVVHEDSRGIEGLDVEMVPGNVLDPAGLDKAIAGAEVVYHCAANINVGGVPAREIFQVNVEGPRNVVDTCLKHKVRRLIHFSSIHALSEHPLDKPVCEANGLLKEGESGLPYSHSKAAGQRAVLAAVERGLDAVVVNPASVLGPHDYRLSYMGETIRDIARGKLPAVVPGGYDFVDARDIAATAMAAEEKGRTGECYLLSGNWASVKDLAGLVADAAGVKAPGWTCPMWMAYSAAPFSQLWAKVTGQRPKFTVGSLKVLQGNSRADHSKAARELGHAPRPLAQTVADTVAWQREAGWY